MEIRFYKFFSIQWIPAMFRLREEDFRSRSFRDVIFLEWLYWAISFPVSEWKD